MKNNPTADQLVKYERLYELLTRSPDGQPVQPSQDDIAMLDFFAAEVMHGVDLERNHTEFFAKMQTQPRLFQAFIDVLKQFEEKPDLLSAPTPADFKLDFLAKSGSVLVRTHFLANWWSLVVDVGRQQIEQMIKSKTGHDKLTLSGVMRSGNMLQLDPQRIKFIDEIIEADGLTLHLSLEGVLFSDELMLELLLFINELNDQTLPDNLTADLHWGELHFQASIKALDLTRFPKISLPDVVSKDHKILHGMQIKILQDQDGNM